MRRWTSEPRALPLGPGWITLLEDSLRIQSDLIVETTRIYHKVLEVESATVDPLDLVRTRLVGYFILYAPTPESLAAVVELLHKQSLAGAIGQVCYELGNELLEQFVRPFMRRRFETSAYDSGDEYDSDEEKSKRPRVSVMLEQAPQNARYAKMVTLYRDAFRCKLTDTFDVCSLVYMPLAQRIFSETEGAEAGQIYNRHIIPDLAADGLISNEALWDLFAKLGLPELRAELADGIHRLENMLTLRADVCGLMDDLNLCLTPVKGKADGNYNVVLFGKYAEERESVRGLPEKKAFWLSRRVPNPSTKYLRIHATCSYIAHYSGAIEWSEDGVISRVIRVGDDQCDDEDVDIHHFVDSDGDVIDLFSLSDIDDDTDADTCNQ